MPLYEYKCGKCGSVFEVLQRFSDKPLETHENCGGKVERLISAPGLQFKGTGWYVTDYARGKSSAAGGKNGHKSDKSDSSSTPAASKEPASSGKSAGDKP